jgi:hypothetical protein
MPELDRRKNQADNCRVAAEPAIFSDQTIEALQEFGKVLLRIHRRLVTEGKIIEVDPHYAKRNGN